MLRSTSDTLNVMRNDSAIFHLFNQNRLKGKEFWSWFKIKWWTCEREQI